MTAHFELIGLHLQRSGGSVHQLMLHDLPLFREPAALALQRRVVLRMSSSEVAESSRRVQRATNIVCTVIPMLSTGAGSVDLNQFRGRCPTDWRP